MNGYGSPSDRPPCVVYDVPETIGFTIVYSRVISRPVMGFPN